MFVTIRGLEPNENTKLYKKKNILNKGSPCSPPFGGLEPKKKLYKKENILKMDFKIYTILPKIFPGSANIILCFISDQV